jgi:lysophospholipase L1-like esterase
MFMYTRILTAVLLAAHAQALQFLGRVNPATKQLTWPGDGLSFKFIGTEAFINFSAISGTNSVALTIDEGLQIVIPNVSNNSISTGTLSSGAHTVVLRRRSEADFGILTFQDITTSGTIGADRSPSRRIEFIGDSITVGYGEDGTFPCTNTAALEDAPNTYGALTAGNLSAEYSLIAWSGKGVTRNYVQLAPDTSPIMPELWTRYGALDADNTYTFPAKAVPQAVVINLGTNDYSYRTTAANGSTVEGRPPLNNMVFQQAYTKFVQAVQSHYPKAEFFLTSSPLLSDSSPTTADMQHTSEANAIKGAIAAINSSKLHFVEFPTQPGTEDTIGCDYHPGPTEHQVMAAILLPIMQRVLGW